jgi:hypothetical protein
MSVRLDLPVCEALAARAARGDEPAGDELVFTHLWPTWLALVRGSRFLGRLRGSDDHVEDIRAALARKVKKTLGSYPAWRARNPDKTLADWNRIAVANAVRRHVKRRIGDPMDALVESDPSLKEILNEFTLSPVLDRLGARPAMTMAQTAAELIAFARTHLGEKERRALSLWLEGASFDEIAEELGLGSSEEAEKAQRAAVAVLRRAFRAG